MPTPTKGSPTPESQVPSLAREATSRAHQKALASGKRVLVARGGKVLRIYPDGTESVVKQTLRATTVKVGSRRRLT